MTYKPYTSKDKWIVAIVSGLIFLLLSSPFLYEITDKIFSMFKISNNGCPTVMGLILHTIFFMLIIRLLMR